jgi:hypothetical protein
MKRQKSIDHPRFVACTQPRWLLNFLLDAARRAIAGGRFWEFSYSTGGHFRDSYTPLNGQLNLKRHETFRGKFSRRNNQNKLNPSKKGRNRANIIHEQP